MTSAFRSPVKSPGPSLAVKMFQPLPIRLAPRTYRT